MRWESLPSPSYAPALTLIMISTRHPQCPISLVLTAVSQQEVWYLERRRGPQECVGVEQAPCGPPQALRNRQLQHWDRRMRMLFSPCREKVGDASGTVIGPILHMQHWSSGTLRDPQ